MADNKSCEDKYRIWGCMDCGHNHYYHKNDYRQDGLQCDECNGPVNVKGFTNQKPLPLQRTPNKSKSDSIGSLTTKLSIDVSDVLTGLKSVQREARKATMILKEFEQAFNETKSIADKCNVSDQEIFSLLARPEVSK